MYLLIYFVEALILQQYYSALFKRKRPFWLTTAAIFLSYGIIGALFSPSLVWINIVIFTLLNYFLLLFLFECSWKTCFFHAIALTALMFSTEEIVLLVLGILFDGFEKYLTNTVMFVLLAIFSKLLYFLFSQLCVRVAKRNTKREKDLGPFALLFGSFTVASIIIWITFGYTALEVNLPIFIETSMIVAAFILLIADLLVYAAYQQSQVLSQQYLSMKLLEQREKSEEHYFKTLEEHYTQQRVLIHDIRQHLTVMKDLAEDQKDGQVVDYIENLESAPALQRKIRYCNNPMLNVILSRYREICEEKGIAFSPDIRNVSLDFLSPGDITSLFGNLLENAVEAAEGAENPSIELRIDASRGKAFLFSLVNSCRQPPQPDTDDGFVSLKPDHGKHGIGLKSVRNTVKKYHGTLWQSYDPEKTQFHTVILL